MRKLDSRRKQQNGRRSLKLCGSPFHNKKAPYFIRFKHFTGSLPVKLAM